MSKIIEQAEEKDLLDILHLQKKAFEQVAEIVNNPNIHPMVQTYAEILCELDKGIILKYTLEDAIVGSVRAQLDESNCCHIGKLIVDPNYQNRGIGRMLMKAIEQQFYLCNKYTLFTGLETPNTVHLYTQIGYIETARETVGNVSMIVMEKVNKSQ